MRSAETVQHRFCKARLRPNRHLPRNAGSCLGLTVSRGDAGGVAGKALSGAFLRSGGSEVCKAGSGAYFSDSWGQDFGDPQALLPLKRVRGDEEAGIWALPS